MSPKVIGFICALGAFCFWGLVPIYWKQITGITSLELLGHRIIWGVLVLIIYLAFKDRKLLVKNLKSSFSKLLFLSSTLIFANWYIFIWAINNNHILDASLAYFLNPLLNIVIGWIFFKENMSRLKLTALAVASLGVINLFVFNTGNLYVVLSLAITFSIYGVIKKISKVSSEYSVLFEMALWLPASLIYFFYLYQSSGLLILNQSTSEIFYISAAGLITIIPLWLFSKAVKLIDFGTIGFLQYVAPSLQFLVGVFIYMEPLNKHRTLSFALIWIGIAFYFIELIFLKKKKN